MLNLRRIIPITLVVAAAAVLSGCGGSGSGGPLCQGVTCPPGSSCVDGVCRCPQGKVNCGDVCAELSSDINNCGRCGEFCGRNATCISGQCVCGQVNCGAGEVVCQEGACDICADLSSDPYHCGNCGNDCPPDATCVSGTCTCPTGKVDCGNECADLSSSVNNCGSCGRSCDVDIGACVSGTCTCPGSLVMCGARCRDLSLDPSHCGNCGNQCNQQQYCTSGTCQCRPGLTDCVVACVDLTSNDNHCGACNQRCTAQTGGIFCYQSQCTDVACDQQDPLADFCNPNGESCVLETSFEKDPQNCGGCNNRCDSDELCIETNCLQFDIGRNCTGCPCNDCGPFERCCQYPGAATVICIDGANACP